MKPLFKNQIQTKNLLRDFGLIWILTLFEKKNRKLKNFSNFTRLHNFLNIKSYFKIDVVIMKLNERSFAYKKKTKKLCLWMLIFSEFKKKISKAFRK